MKDTHDDRSPATDESTSDATVPTDTEWSVIAQAPYEPSESGGLTTTIVFAVADAEGVSPSDVKEPPLYDVVDTSALEAALFDSETGARSDHCSTEFMYRGYRVVVRSDGWVIVHDRVES